MADALVLLNLCQVSHVGFSFFISSLRLWTLALIPVVASSVTGSSDVVASGGRR